MKNFFFVSIAQKYLMGITGLGLAIFVLLHMLGNLLIFAGPKAYNLYAHRLVDSGWILIFEAGLLALFVLHIVLAVFLSFKNRKARGGGKYFFPARGLKATSYRQKSLLAQGAVVLVFVILHLITFKFGAHYEVSYEDGRPVRDIFRLVEESFQNPVTVIWYIAALLILSVHLLHGLSSSLKSLGLEHPRFDPYMEKACGAYAVIVTAGYISLPLYLFFKAPGF